MTRKEQTDKITLELSKGDAAIMNLSSLTYLTLSEKTQKRKISDGYAL